MDLKCPVEWDTKLANFNEIEIFTIDMFTTDKYKTDKLTS